MEEFVSIDISNDVAGQLKALTRRMGATPFIAMLTAFKILLVRLTGQEDILVGAPFSGRVDSKTLGLIGCFVNMLALRTDLGGNPSFSEALIRVRSRTLAMHNHQDLPLAWLLRELQPELHERGGLPYQVVFNYY
jgi:non-ribosomal peptide synthetase component F